MKRYSKPSVITFAVINIITTILSALAILVIYSLAIAFTPSDTIDQNSKIFMQFTSITIILDVVKWIAFYFIVSKGQKMWYLFYVLYIFVIGYVAITFVPWGIIVPLIYIFVLVNVLEKQEE